MFPRRQQPRTPPTAASTLARIERASVLSQILTLEPNLLPTIQRTLEAQFGMLSSPTSYQRDRVYVALKQACMSLVGTGADNAALRTHRHWEIFVEALFTALPPDCSSEREMAHGEDASESDDGEPDC